VQQLDAPLERQTVAAPSFALWWVIRIDLALVGLGSLGLLASLLLLDPPAPRGCALAVVGLLPFDQRPRNRLRRRR
jgi:hypothetical protein